MPAVARAATYYVSPTGSDGQAGTSPATAWRTIGKVNGFPLSPGDSVLFAGGSSFTDAALAPLRSGASGLPITFGSYGTGRATVADGVSLSGANYLEIVNMRFTAPVAGSGDDITLQRNVVTLAAGNASIAVQASGTNWVLTNNTIRNAGSTGISMSGSAGTLTGNVVLDSGSNSSAGAERNGITVHATDTKITGNVIQNFASSGVWIDSPGDTVQDNYIAESHWFPTLASTYGIVWRQNRQAGGTSTWRTNTIAGTTGSDILVEAGSFPVAESFVIGRNSLMRFSGGYMTLSATTGTCQCTMGANLLLGESSGRTYYVAQSGNDHNSGTTPVSPWKTVSQVDTPSANHPGLVLKPGDVVLFRAGQSFGDQQIDPVSGASGKPVVYGSWGNGQATIAPASAPQAMWFLGVHDVVVQDLTLQGASTPNAGAAIFSHDGASDCSDHICSYDVVVNSCRIHHWLEGVHTNAADHDWTVEYTEIDHTTDNGIFFDRSGSGPYYGSTRMNALYNRISDTGLNPPAHPHAIYDNSTSSLVIGNRIARFGDGILPSSGISVRFTNSVVESNTIDGGGIAQGNGIDLYDYASAPQCTPASPCPSLWAYNRIVNVKGNGIYLDYHYGPSSTCGASCLPTQAFTIANNTILLASPASEGASMLDFEYPDGSVTIANNIGSGASAQDLGIDNYFSTCPIPATVTAVEHNDDWSNTGSDQWRYCGATYTTLAGYQSTGLGAGDLNAPPQVDQTTFVLAPTSPAIDAGTTAVAGAPAYHATCRGQRFQYCGSAPDMGAVEFGPDG